VTSSHTGHGVGLNNVRSRLNRLYGAKCTFEIISDPVEGVAVIMQFPLQPVYDPAANLV
jgi:LytS/YehU family sensor histidine kinase